MDKWIIVYTDYETQVVEATDIWDILYNDGILTHNVNEIFSITKGYLI